MAPTGRKNKSVIDVCPIIQTTITKITDEGERSSPAARQRRKAGLFSLRGAAVSSEPEALRISVNVFPFTAHNKCFGVLAVSEFVPLLGNKRQRRRLCLSFFNMHPEQTGLPLTSNVSPLLRFYLGSVGRHFLTRLLIGLHRSNATYSLYKANSGHGRSS